MEAISLAACAGHNYAVKNLLICKRKTLWLWCLFMFVCFAETEQRMNELLICELQYVTECMSNKQIVYHITVVNNHMKHKYVQKHCRSI